MKFELYKDEKGEFRWRFKAANGETICTCGQGYKAKADAKHGIDVIQADVKGDKLKFEAYEDNKKEHRWRLRASNGQVIASSSQGYKNKGDCEKSIALLKDNATKAEVVDMTTEK